jgi:ribonuclease-3
MSDQATGILGYAFHDSSLLREALTHASTAHRREQSNERMEFLGDAVLDLVVSEHLYRRYPHAMEGELTKIKSEVVSRRVCAQVSQELDLDSLLNLSKSFSTRQPIPRSVAAAVLESILAAIYLDGGLEAARDFVLTHMNRHIEAIAESGQQSNFKSELQQVTQRHRTEVPTYEVLEEQGPDHDKSFRVRVWVGSRAYPPAWGGSKKEAEQQAALEALCALGVAERGVDGAVTWHADRVAADPGQ